MSHLNKFNVSGAFFQDVRSNIGNRSANGADGETCEHIQLGQAIIQILERIDVSSWKQSTN